MTSQVISSLPRPRSRRRRQGDPVGRATGSGIASHVRGLDRGARARTALRQWRLQKSWRHGSPEIMGGTRPIDAGVRQRLDETCRTSNQKPTRTPRYRQIGRLRGWTITLH